MQSQLYVIAAVICQKGETKLNTVVAWVVGTEGECLGKIRGYINEHFPDAEIRHIQAVQPPDWVAQYYREDARDGGTLPS